MLLLFSWLIFGLLVGWISKKLHPGDDPVGYLPTIGIGVAGSFIGGLVNWVLGLGTAPFQASGLLMSILGGVLFCIAWRWYKLRTSESGPKSFFTGRSLR